MCGGEKKNEKKNPNVLGLPVVDWMGVGLGNFTHFKQEKKLSVNVNHFNFFKGSIFFFCQIGRAHV